MITFCCGCVQLAAETLARDAQEEVERKALAAEEAAKKKAATGDKKGGKGGKELSPTPKKSKVKESSSPIPGVNVALWFSDQCERHLQALHPFSHWS